MKQPCILCVFVLALPLALVVAGSEGGGGNQGPGNGNGNSQHAMNETGNALVATNSTSGPGSGKGPQGPRGDDPRPRNWETANSRNETEFDDRKSPRKVDFLGQSANIRIYPNYTDTNVYIQLRFGKVEELDSAGRRVPGHAIPSLADPNAVTFTAGNHTINGVNMSYVNVTVDPQHRSSFNMACRAPGSDDSDNSTTTASGGHRRLLARILRATTVPAPKLQLSLWFGLDEALTVPYGDVNITVPRNGMKWTMSYQNWPFCNTSNTLAVYLHLDLANNASAQIASDAANNETKVLHIALGSSYNSSLGFLNYALTGQQSTDGVRMPVNTNMTQDGSVTTVQMALPNPSAWNATSVWYDPTQTTTSAYLTADDPGNVASAGVASVLESGTGSAGALRTTLWTLVSAVLLSALLTGA